MIIQNSNLKFKPLGKRARTEYIVLHHSAASGSIEAVHNYHLNLGWSGVGYHLYVRKEGSIWQGRPLDTIGAHAGASFNNRSVGICAEGNFETEKMTETQKQALVQALAYVWRLYPSAKVVGHRNLAATACPGANFPFDEIVAGARALKDQNPIKPTPDPKPQVPAPPTAPTKTGTGIFLPVLRRGSKGEAVKSMQVLLTGRGFKPGRWGADGSFGGATERALKNFQASQGLAADGICDFNTWNNLLFGKEAK